MKSLKFFALILGIAVIFHPHAAFSTDVSGDVWGTWTLANSPYYAIGDVRVPPDSTLTIEPGVEVYFSGYYKFIVDNLAVLHAVGTETDSILFDEGIQGNGWHGIRFLNASSQSQLSYCILRNGYASGGGDDNKGGAIYCSNSSPLISNNTITGNWAPYGAAIYCKNSSSPIISNNTITGNSANYDSGAIYCYYSSPTIINNTITGNTANGGSNGAINCYHSDSTTTISNNIINSNSARNNCGAINCAYSSPTINNNIISDNYVSSINGGAIYCTDSYSTISNNVISGNHSNFGSGGAIYCTSAINISSPTIRNNIITGNSADNGSGGAIFCSYSSPNIISNTITGNSAYNGGAVHLKSCYNDLISDNVISGNTAQNLGGIYFSSSTPVMTNNTLSGNSASSWGGILCADSTVADISNSILWGDLPPLGDEIGLITGSSANVSYSDIEGGWPGTGNIDADPLFVNPTADNLHLHWGSPCIDMGDPASPPDPDGTTADMGAPYFDQSTSPTIEIYPQGEPITIPPGGGSIIFDSWIYNLSGTSGETLDVWTMANVPGFGWYGPIDLLTSIYVPPDGRIGRNNLARYVVGGAPAGDYTYVGYIGTFPNVVADSSYFTFTKESSGTMGSEGGNGLTADRIFRGSPSNSLSPGPMPR